MRLIDAELLEEQFGISDADILAKEEIRYAPTVDAVVVTRCKDCTKFEQKGKYYNGRPFGYCYHLDYEEGSSPNEVDGDDFCSYGERRDKP